MEHEISLPDARWRFETDKPLGPAGGFGEVFLGTDMNGAPVAVKQLKIDAKEAAFRELRIAQVLQEKKFSYVMPFLDAGQDAESDRYYVVMPVAEKSLADYLEEHGSVNESQAIEILNSIVKGLLEVENFIHRDLKPGNILLFDSTWRVADFGIAKFVEESTSLQTLKRCLSPPFAAPEQWQLHTPTHATDVYALGCMGYCLLTGQPPFSGPEMADFRMQHLSVHPEPIETCSPRLRSLILMMLRKTSESRPSLSRIESILKPSLVEISGEVGPDAFEALAEAGAHIVKKQSETEAKKAQDRLARENRRQIAQEAERIFADVRHDLFETIAEAAPAAQREDVSRIRLGSAVLIMQLTGDEGGFMESPFRESGWGVILGGEIAVRQGEPTYIWSSSLWYAKISPNDEYRWREVSYFGSPFLSQKHNYEPHALDNTKDADIAASTTMGPYQLAFGPVPIDDEDLESFKSRWADLFAKAVNGRLEIPRRLPL